MLRMQSSKSFSFIKIVLCRSCYSRLFVANVWYCSTFWVGFFKKVDIVLRSDLDWCRTTFAYSMINCSSDERIRVRNRLIRSLIDSTVWKIIFDKSSAMIRDALADELAFKYYSMVLSSSIVKYLLSLADVESFCIFDFALLALSVCCPLSVLLEFCACFLMDESVFLDSAKVFDRVWALLSTFITIFGIFQYLLISKQSQKLLSS